MKTIAALLFSIAALAQEVPRDYIWTKPQSTSPPQQLSDWHPYPYSIWYHATNTKNGKVTFEEDSFVGAKARGDVIRAQKVDGLTPLTRLSLASGLSITLYPAKRAKSTRGIEHPGIEHARDNVPPCVRHWEASPETHESQEILGFVTLKFRRMTDRTTEYIDWLAPELGCEPLLATANETDPATGNRFSYTNQATVVKKESPPASELEDYENYTEVPPSVIEISHACDPDPNPFPEGCKAMRAHAAANDQRYYRDMEQREQLKRSQEGAARPQPTPAVK